MFQRKLTKYSIWVLLLLSTNVMAQNATNVKGNDPKVVEGKSLDKVPAEKTLRDFGKMDLEILYLEKAKKLEDLKAPKSVSALQSGVNSPAETKQVMSLLNPQTASQTSKRSPRTTKSKNQNSTSAIAATPPIPRPTFKLKSIFGTAGNLTAVLSTGENSVTSVKKGQMVNGWLLDRFLDNGVVVKQGEHQAILIMSHEKVPNNSLNSLPSAESVGTNQLSARQLPNPRIEQ